MVRERKLPGFQNLCTLECEFTQHMEKRGNNLELPGGDSLMKPTLHVPQYNVLDVPV